MKTHNLKILAIETSCDETAAAVIGVENREPVILSNIVSSQIDLHAKTGGVVPEVASRAHMESMVPVVSEALIKAKLSGTQEWTTNKTNHENDSSKNSAISFLQKEIDYIAVTAGPGLVGSLLVGFNAAKSLAYALDKPIIAVNHIEGHIYSALGGVQKWTTDKTNHEKDPDNLSTIEFPILALTVSGGHTSITLMKDHGQYKNIGQTLDDAAGEAFDKVAKLLGLGYPGGPIVSKLAAEYRSQKWTTNKTNHEMLKSLSGSYGSLSISDRKAVVFPRPILNDGTFNFSFSGLKTAVLQKVLNIKKERELLEEDKKEVCAAFEDAVVDVLTTKTIRAAEKYKPKAIILAGGVAANGQLREILESKISKLKFKVKYLPAPRNLTGDNAAMIGLAAYYHIQKDNIDSWDKIKVDSNLEL